MRFGTSRSDAAGWFGGHGWRGTGTPLAFGGHGWRRGAAGTLQAFGRHGWRRGAGTRMGGLPRVRGHSTYWHPSQWRLQGSDRAIPTAGATPSTKEGCGLWWHRGPLVVTSSRSIRFLPHLVLLLSGRVGPIHASAEFEDTSLVPLW